MTTFDQREQGFENKYIHDQEIEFRVTRRRNKLLGLWAAQLFGLGEPEAASYAKELAVSDLKKNSEDGLVRRVLNDFSSRGVAMDERQLRKKLAELQTKAHAKIMAETNV